MGTPVGVACAITNEASSPYLQEFERFRTAGLIKHLGISNFNESQIQRLLDNGTAKPEVLQVTVHLSDNPR